MPGREHDRIPYAVRVEYRNASSFLVAYSLNLSRGGVFLETTALEPIGSEVTIQFSVPGAQNVTVRGRVAWQSEQEPVGLGVEFHDMVDSLGEMIDGLVVGFRGVKVLLMCGDRHDLSSLKRMIRSIIAAAKVVVVTAEDTELLTDESVDLVILDADFDPGAALTAARAIRKGAHAPPIVVLASSKNVREQARAAGANEVTNNPPAMAEFRRLLVGSIGRPASISAE